jgi:hypothetical protein
MYDYFYLRSIGFRVSTGLSLGSLSCHHLVLHLGHLLVGAGGHAATRPLLPLGLRGRVSASLLLLRRASRHALTLRHHSSEAGCIRKHFVLLNSLRVLIPVNRTHHIILFSLRLPLVLIRMAVSVDWRLRSDSVFRWCRARFLRVCSLSVYHTLVHVSVRHAAH